MCSSLGNLTLPSISLTAAMTGRRSRRISLHIMSIKYLAKWRQSLFVTKISSKWKTQWLSRKNDSVMLWTFGSVQTPHDCGGVWPPSRFEDHLKMEHISLGFQTKALTHISMEGQKQETNIFSCVLCVCVGSSALPEIPLLRSFSQRPLARAARGTSPRGKQRKDRRGTIWDFGFAFSFLFSHQRKLQACSTGHILMKYYSAERLSHFFGLNIRRCYKVHQTGL